MTSFMSVQHLLDSQASTIPNKTAIVCLSSGESVNYRQLRDSCIDIAAALSLNDVPPGGKIALLLENSIGAAQLLIGTMYGGRVPVPLNIKGGSSHIYNALIHSDASLLFVDVEGDRCICSTFPSGNFPAKIIKCHEQRFPETQVVHKNPYTVLPEDDVIIDYTSGSTGAPKGVLLTHAALLAGSQNTVAAHQLTGTDTTLLVLPLYHANAQVITLFPTLMSGGTVILSPRFSASLFWKLVVDYKCTWFALVPSMIAQLLSAVDNSLAVRASFSHVRFARSSSAPLPPVHHSRFEELFGIPLLEAMGTTEAGSVIFSNPLPPARRKVGSPGIPQGFDVRVTTSNGQDLPAGSDGFIKIRGPSIMKCYYKNPAETCSALDSDGWFTLGDVGHYDKEGYYFITGRQKELIIRGGENIAPREIDEAICQLPEVVEAAAVGIPDEHLGEDVIAFVVLRPETTLSYSDILNYCECKIGRIKTPTELFFVDSLPKGPTGKVLRLQLQEQFMEERKKTGHIARSLTPQENQENVIKTLTKIWQQVLNLEHVGPDDNFFAIGGDSLSALYIITIAQSLIAPGLKISDFFDTPTITGIVEAAYSKQAEREELETRIDCRLNPGEPCPLTSAQKRIWVLEELAPDQPMHNECEAIKLSGRIDLLALEEAFNEEIARHEALRIGIEIINSEPFQIVHKNVSLKIRHSPLKTTFTGELREAEVLEMAHYEARQKFDLAEPPLLRVVLYSFSEEKHVLQITMHHLICDRYSFGVLFEEVGVFYTALLNGEKSDLAPPSLQFSDFAVWSASKVGTTTEIADIKYWQRQLKGADLPLQLPVDRQRKSRFSHVGSKEYFELGESLTDELKSFAREQRVTMFSVVASVLSVLLYRYSFNPDITIGLAVTARDRAELLRVIGFMADILVLRTRISPVSSFLDHITYVSRLLRDGYNHRSVSFERLLAELHPSSDITNSQFLNVLLNWPDNASMELMKLPGLETEQFNIHNGTAKFDMTWWFINTDNGVQGKLEYNTDLLNKETVKRFIRHYKALLRAAIRQPREPITALTLIPTDEQRLLTQTSISTSSDYLKASCISRLVEYWAHQNPESLAVVSTTEEITYHELNTRANRLAHWLIEHDVQKDVPVGICMERCLEMVVAMLAVLKTGGAYVPLDPSYPPTRLAQMLANTRALVIITNETSEANLPTGDHQVLCMETLDFCSSNGNCNDLLYAPDPDNLAYVIFTSGSTGRPKGVAVSHRAIMRLVVATDYLQLTQKDVVAQVSSSSFDAATWEIWGPLVNGGQVVIIPTDVLLNSDALAESIHQHGITAMFVTTALFNRIAQKAPCTFAELKTLLFGGEASYPKAVAHVLSNRPPRRLIHVYGPTEATTFATWFPVESISRDFITIPIGRPISNTSVFVMDCWGNPVPIGVKGELHIGGPGLAREYFNQPELTTEKFVIDLSGERLYKTGDLARRLSDGNIEIVGRLDDQVKIRGYRVEPNEVVSAILALPEIKEAVVLTRDDDFRGKHLVAYVVSDRWQEISSEKLRTSLKNTLPDFMIPSVFVPLESLPLTASGKLDRSSLPIQSWKHRDICGGLVAPRTSIEKRLAAIWCHSLQINELGVHDNFFDMGGDSLLGAGLVTDIRTEFRADIPLQLLFESPTIAKMAARFEKIMMGGDEGQSLMGSTGHCMVRIQKGHAGPPLFFVPGGGGGESVLLVYARLARQIGPDIPFYGFLACGLDGVSHPHTSVKKMAEAYLSEIRDHQPSGPYFLAGECVGGVVAFEIARQLENAGQSVAFLALLDTYYRSPIYYIASFFKGLFYKLKSGWKSLFNPETEEYLVVRFLHEILSVLIFIGDEFGLVWPNRHPDNPEARWWYMNRVQMFYQRVLQRYKPGEYNGDITLFVTENCDLGKLTADWRSFTSGNIEIRAIPSDHIEYIRDQSPIIGRVFRNSFVKAREEIKKAKVDSGSR